jgi:hypothetical protein
VAGGFVVNNGIVEVVNHDRTLSVMIGFEQRFGDHFARLPHGGELAGRLYLLRVPEGKLAVL